MPIYEYQCLSCGKKTEVLQRLAEAPITVCPQCGGEVKKLISSPAFQFKGSGWYATDYGGKSGGAEPKAEAKSESKSDEGGKSEKAEKPKEAAAGAKSSGSSGGGSE